MRETITLFGIVLAVVAGVAVLLLKLAVQEKSQDLRSLQAAVMKDKEAIRVLETEWSYRTTPAKLKDKSLRFLALMPPTADQVITDPTVVPFRASDRDVDGNVDVLWPEAVRKKLREIEDGVRTDKKRTVKEIGL